MTNEILPNTIYHELRGEDRTRPDSITFGDSTKVPGLKIYVDFNKPEEMTDLIDTAFTAYGYALNKMMQMKEQNPQLFPGGGK